MAITEWPLSERPREKLLEQGPEALTDAELLAIFLRTGAVGLSAVDLAHRLLARFGGLRPLLTADQASFCEAPGLGPAKHIQLRAITEMTRRYLAEPLTRGATIESTSTARDFLVHQFRGQSREVFACLFLDTRHRILAFEELFYGTIDGAQVYIREVVKRALSLNAAALIAAHNHPSGIAEPSIQDIHLTERLKQALELVEVRLLDHFVVGDTEVTSFAQQGYL